MSGKRPPRDGGERPANAPRSPSGASSDQRPRPRLRPPQGRRTRPAAARRAVDPQLTVDEALLFEANRRISVREGKRTVEISVRQAVVRAVATNALNGKPSGPQLAFLQRVAAAEARREATQQALFKCMLEYKTYWEEARAAGETPSRLLPLHPEDVQLDWAAGRVIINGPQSEMEHAHWADMHARRAAAVEELAELRAEMAQVGGGSLRGVYEDELAFEQMKIDLVDACFPSESVRRQVGFDLQASREKYQAQRAADRAANGRTRTRRRAP